MKKPVKIKKSHRHFWKSDKSRRYQPNRPPFWFFWSCWCGAVRVTTVTINPLNQKLSSVSHITEPHYVIVTTEPAPDSDPEDTTQDAMP